MTPAKRNTSSQLEKELVGGAGDLSSAAKRGGILKRSNSLPGSIRMVLVENSFFSEFTRAEALDDHIQMDVAKVEIRTRSQSVDNYNMEVSVSPDEFIRTKGGDDLINLMDDKVHKSPRENLPIALTLGSRASPTLLESKATPGSRLSKRQLNISPQTPRGGPRKLSVCEGASPPLREHQGRTRSYSLTFFYDEEGDCCMSERKDRRPAANGSGKVENVRKPAARDFAMVDQENRRPAADGSSLIFGARG